MRRYLYITVAIATIVAALFTYGNSLADNSSANKPTGNNQPQLNNDVTIIRDFQAMIAGYGFAAAIKTGSNNSHDITLPGKTKPHNITCTNQIASLIVFVDKAKGKKLCWKYHANGKDLWLTDSNKQPVEVLTSPTPIFDTDAENRWRVSLDKGKTYTQLLDASGKPIIQQGKHPGLFKEIDITKANVTLTLANNKKIKLSRTPDQRGALEALYYALDGDNWARKRNWLSGEDIRTWQGITCDDEGYITKINLRINCLKGVLPDVFAAFPRCKRILLNNGGRESETDNFLTGVLPQSMTTYIETTEFDLRYNDFETTSFAVPEEKIDIATNNFKPYPASNANYDFRLFIDSDVDGTGEIHEHLSCYQYQKATEGKGVDIYFIGDGFDAAHHTKGGTVDYWYKKAAEATFAIEPMNKLRKYYNVFFIYAHSEERGVGLFNNPRKSMYRYWQKNPTRGSGAQFRSQNVATAIEMATGGRPLPMDGSNRVSISMIFNSTNNGLYAGMMYSRRPMYKGEKTPIAVALNPTRETKNGGFATLLQHEFVGHAIGGIHDEYGTEKSKKHPNPTTVKWGPNLDTIADPTKCKWAQFYNDPRYAHEKIGCYPGGRNFSNVYRPTEKSIINGGRKRTKEFNAPSRASIYRRTMQRAFDNWTFDYEEFVKFDDPKPKTTEK